MSTMNNDLLDFIEVITAWHTKKVTNLRNVQEGVKEGTLLKLGEDEDGIELTEREAQFFRLGIEAVLMELGVLPFTMTRNEDSGDDGSDEDDAE